ncbi:MAG: sensor histidine kinase, partial [Myxococcota bacterium]
RVQEEMRVDADQNLLEMILLNLLGNARKFAALGGGSQIELGCFDQAGERVFFVKDDGPGFDPALSRLLFKPFARFEPRSAGTGVGLATVQRAVSRHGGRVWAQGRPGEGATFYFTLNQQP